jgi:hypothetical protein
MIANTIVCKANTIDLYCVQLIKLMVSYNAAMRMGKGGEEGLWTKDSSGKNILNTGKAGRGRIHDAATRFPKCMVDQLTWHARTTLQCPK